MAIYLNIATRRREFVDEAGVDFRVTSGPNLDVGTWGDVLLYYWAESISFYDAGGSVIADGHMGLQAYDHADLAKKSVINWGVYDLTISGSAVCRSSGLLTPDTFIDINNPVSMGYDFSYNEWIRFRVFKSPKQDWLAGELFPGTEQVPPYVGTDQQADEVAYRCTVENVTRGTVPVEFHDALIKSPRAAKPINHGSCWTEPIPQAGYPGDIDSDWPYSPECHVRNPVWDGAGMISQYLINYQPAATNCNITAVSGTPGYMRMKGGETRTNADGAIVAVPSGLWDAAQANVAPAPVDAAARIPTRRPWF